MKINTREIVGYRTEERTRIIPPVLDEEGNIIEEEREETYTVNVPITEVITRDMTPEEESAYLAEQAEAESHRYDGMSYSDIVESLIRERYSVSDELAILRQRDTKADEFETYNLFAEECKQRAKELI